MVAYFINYNLSGIIQYLKSMNSQGAKISIFTLFIFVFLTSGSLCIMTMEQAGLFIFEQVQTDVNHKIMMTRVAPYLNVSYLSKVDEEESLIQTKNAYFGKIWGRSARVFVNLPVRLNYKNCPTLINVIFLVNTGSPITTLTTEALQTLFGNCPQVQKTYSDIYPLKITGFKISVSESRDLTDSFNILGSNFFRLTNAQLQVNYFEKSIFPQESVQIKFRPESERKICE